MSKGLKKAIKNMMTELDSSAEASKAMNIVLKCTELDPKYTELKKVHEMLLAEKIPHLYVRFHNGWCIRFEDSKMDAVQHFGSYGERENLIEIIHALTEEEKKQDDVLGYLTAEEVFKRFKYCYNNKTLIYKEKGERNEKL